VSTTAAEGSASYALLQDRSLVLQAEAGTLPLIEPWLPLSCSPVHQDDDSRAMIVVSHAHSPETPGYSSNPTLRLGQVEVRLDDHEDRALLRGTTGATGIVDLASLVTRIDADIDVNGSVRDEVYSMLTVSSALLLGRLGCALVHAGAVVAPNGGSWLVVGDARSGKSTTCVSLVMSGCDYLSDDQVVLAPRQGCSAVERWLRPLHLDEGWEQGVPSGERRTLQPSELGPGSWRRTARVAGVFVTRVEADQPTQVSTIASSEAFTALVRQSPWLMADRAAAQSAVDLLSAVCRLPHFELQLGLDTFGKPAQLRTLLDRIVT